MGNWRTVNITGTMSAADALALDPLLDQRDLENREVWGKPYACLSYDSISPGLCGLGNWPVMLAAVYSDPGHVPTRCGNLAERDYSVEDVADALREMVRVAPSMLLKVHCGGEYESDECVATISVGEGLVVVGKPEQPTVAGPPEDQMMGNLFANLMRPR